VRKCIFRKRRFRIGETVEAEKGTEGLKHFVPEASYSEKSVVPEPRTFKEVQARNKKNAPAKGMAAKPKKGAKGKGKKPEDPFA